MERIMIAVIATVLLSGTVVAQKNVQHKRAKQITLTNVILRRNTELGLSEEQTEEIRELQSEFGDFMAERVAASLDLKRGEPFVGTVFELARRQTQEEREEIDAIEETQSLKIKSVLSPEQLKLAEQFVLRDRIRMVGVKAILGSDDLDVANIDFSHDERKIQGELDDARERADRQIRELAEEFRERAREIRQRELDVALGNLGRDGAKIKILMSEIPDDRPAGSPAREFLHPRP